MQDSLHTRAPQLHLGPYCMLIGQLGWEKTDLTRSQTFDGHALVAWSCILCLLSYLNDLWKSYLLFAYLSEFLLVKGHMLITGIVISAEALPGL